VDFFRRQKWDIVGKLWLWALISGLIITTGLVTWALKGLNYGVDFTGGTLLRYQLAQPIALTPADEARVIGQVRAALAKPELGLERSQIQVAGGRWIFIRTYAVANDEEAARRDAAIRAELERLYGSQYGPIQSLGRETVGPVVGAELRRSAILALIIGELLIFLYIAVRYEWRFGLAAIIALLHDILILVSAMAVFRVELDSWFVAAVLTVVGYSVNDSVIIFDRIRENRGRHRHAPLARIVNASLLETMLRSINTTVSTLLPLVALFLLGGPAIAGFSFAMLVGVTTGAASSIFIAAPLVAWWDRLARGRAGAPAARAVTGLAPAAAGATSEAAANQEEGGPAGERLSAVETMRRAAERAQEEKRRLRRERRQKKRARQQAPISRKKRG
jgi:preprotein translocase subunit SecF